MSPHTVTGYTDITRRWLLQSNSQGEQLVMNDFRIGTKTVIDRAVLAGTGPGTEPLGILYHDDVEEVIGATDGAAPSLSHIIGQATKLGEDNALRGRLGCVVSAKLAGTLKQARRSAAPTR